jgi:SAM-dependent methyltransferase
MSDDPPSPKLYRELASWWPILSQPGDYAEEAAIYRKTILSFSPDPVKTMLELGSGGGNNASHLKHTFEMTLVDRSPAMIRVSRALNPECVHIVGDMRTIRLSETFDCVFIHDAIMYMTTEADLRAAIQTAFVHCRPGGIALFAPDHVSETFKPSTKSGGHDLGSRGLRYLEWTWDPDPNDTTTTADFAYLLRDERGVRCVHDQHICGLFSRDTWLGILSEVDFRPHIVPFQHSEIEPGSCEMFIGIKPES